MSLGAALVVFFAGAGVVLATGHSPPTAFWAAGGAVSGGLLGVLTPPPSATSPKSLAADVASGTAQGAAMQAAQSTFQGLADDVKPAAASALADVQGAGNSVAAALQSSSSQDPTTAAAASRGATETVARHQTAAVDAEAAHQAAQQQLIALQRDQNPDQAAVDQAQSAVDIAAAKASVFSAAAAAAGAAQPNAISGGTVAGTISSSSPSLATAWALFAVFAVLLTLSLFLAAGAIVPPSSYGPQALQNATKTVLALASAAGTGLIGLFVPSPGSHGAAS